MFPSCTEYLKEKDIIQIKVQRSQLRAAGLHLQDYSTVCRSESWLMVSLNNHPYAPLALLLTNSQLHTFQSPMHPSYSTVQVQNSQMPRKYIHVHRHSPRAQLTAGL